MTVSAKDKRETFNRTINTDNFAMFALINGGNRNGTRTSNADKHPTTIIQRALAVMSVDHNIQHSELFS